MNITPFANFGNYENIPNLSPEMPSDQTTEDFSAILTNIVTVLQTPDAPSAPAEVVAEQSEVRSVFELPPCDNQPFDKKIFLTENNLLEIPSVEPKQFFSELAELTAETVAPEITVAEVTANQKPSIENPDIQTPTFETSLSEIFVKNDSTVETAVSQKTLTKTSNLEKSTVETPVSETLESLWAGTHATIKQRINDYKFEKAAKEKLKTQINNLFQAQPYRKTETPTKFDNAAQIPAELIPELNTTDNQKVETQPAPRLFQAETSVPLKTRILKFEKPLPKDLVLPIRTTKDYLPTTIPTGQNEVNFNTEMVSRVSEIPVSEVETDLPVEVKIEQMSQTAEVAFKDVEIPIIENKTEIRFTESSPEIQLPQIDVKPRIEGEKIKGFDITQNEVSSILKTFDKFFKKAETPVEAAEKIDVKLENTVGESFEEISKSIKDSFAAVWQVSDSELKQNTTNQPTGFWWNGQKAADDDDKIPVNQMNFQKFENGKIASEVKTQPVTEFQTFIKRPKVESFSNVKIQAENTAPNFKTEVTGAPETRQIQAEKPGIEEIDFGGGFNFDRFLENVSKEKIADTDFRAADVEPKKILEQINPHLLELAALTHKTREKQTLKMRLHPAELGAVEVTVERNQNGSLNAYFQTETDGARVVLSQNIENLRETLQQAGFQVGQMDVSYHSGSSTSHEQRENNARGSASVETFNFSRTSEKPDAAEQKSHNRLLSILA